jgi:hypothetical protein
LRYYPKPRYPGLFSSQLARRRRRTKEEKGRTKEEDEKKKKQTQDFRIFHLGFVGGC